MKLVVVDVSSVSNEPEREFVLPVVKVGRDSALCQIVFDRVTWPMVSRYHSEFRLEAGKCVVFDANSTFGTFVNGQRVKETAEVHAGALIQFGVGGPTLRVKSLEAERVADKLNPDSHSIAWLEIAGQESSVNGRVQLRSEITLLGRDPSSAISYNSHSVSRRHAEIRWRNDQFVLIDLNSYNGTFVNGKRIYEPALLYNNDVVQVGVDTPALRFIDPHHSEQPHKRAVTQLSSGGHHIAAASETLVVPADSGPEPQPQARLDTSKAFIEWTFGDKPYISLGRGEDSDIRLESLQVSVHHARFIKDQDAVLIEDKGSTNGVYVNGKRIDRGRKKLEQNDIVQIGPFVLQAGANTIRVFDTRAKARIDVINVNKSVTQGNGESVKLLDGIDLTIQPNEFIGLLGSSGAGKSTLLNALNGMSAPSAGRVLINDLDLYGHLASLKHSIGYVPQDDIIHRELTVERTLSYVAGLRLSRDVSKEEVEKIIAEVLDVTGLTERRDVPVANLSGGQRKRVSIAVELITKPSIIFLDEPTSGLDPATEEKIMKLFRQITESGRTVVLTTHNTANVHLFDKIVLLMQGRVIFYGEPAEALDHFQVNSFKDLYDLLGNSGGASKPKLKLVTKNTNGNSGKTENSEPPAEKFRRRFQSSELYQRNIVKPLKEVNPSQKGEAITHPRLRFSDAVRQWKTLVRRYIEILARDRMTLLVLLGQAPIIGLLTYLVINEEAPRDFPYFMLALVASWFGTSIAAREIVRERPVYKRERMFNLGLLPYVGSKLFVLTLVVTAQCGVLFATLKILHFAHLTYLPGRYFGLPQLLVMILTGIVGIAVGLLVSALVKTPEVATSLVPLILIPQILFSGINGVPKRMARLTGAAMPVTWSFDEMKRLSGLKPLNEEGSVPKYMQEQLVKVRTNAAINTDLKEFVSFTHPWGGTRVNSLVLLAMLFLFVVGTIAILRAQDRR